MKQKQKIFFSSILIVFSLIFVSFTGCIDSNDDPELPSRGFFMGLLPNPDQHQEFEEVYTQAAEFAEFVPIWSAGTGAEGFWDYADKLSGFWGKTFLDDYIRENDMFPLIHFSFIDKDQQGNLILKTPDTLPEATLNDAEWRTLYKASVLEVIDTVHPKYISIGNEVNRWYESYGISEEDPNGFHHFVSLYEEIYDAVKAVSPDTQVFCVFAREIVSENKEADLSVFSLFNEEKIDVLALTTYPYAVQGITTPSDIPLTYYRQVADMMPNKPFGFTEIGWSTLEVFGGEKGQYDFLMNLSTVLTKDQDVDLHLFGYIWLHDQPGSDTTGLITQDGTEKLGYTAWKAISES